MEPVKNNSEKETISVGASIRGLYDLLSDGGKDKKAPDYGTFLRDVTSSGEARHALYERMVKEYSYDKPEERFVQTFFNPLQADNQVDWISQMDFTGNPAAQQVQMQALNDAAKGQYNPYGTSEVSYFPGLRNRPKAPIDLMAMKVAEAQAQEQDRVTGKTVPDDGANGRQRRPEASPDREEPKETRSFWGGVKSGGKGIWGGLRYAVSDVARKFEANSDDEAEALRILEGLSDEEVSQERVDRMYEEARQGYDEMLRRYPGGILPTRIAALNKAEQRVKALEVLKAAVHRYREGDLSVAERRGVAYDLQSKGEREEAANWGTQEKAKAAEYMSGIREPKGFVANLGSGAVSLVPTAVGGVVSLVPGGQAVGVPLMWAGFGALSGSASGQALYQMDQYAKETGIEIDPETRALVAGGYGVAEFAGDAIGGGVMSGLIKGVGAVGKMGQKMMTRSTLEQLATNPASRQAWKRMVEGGVKSSAVPMMKSTGKAMGKGALVEGAGEATTTLIDTGALDRMYLAPEDQASVGSVLMQSLKDGFYGGLLGGLTGGGLRVMQSAQMVHLHRTQGITIAQTADGKQYEVLGSDGGGRVLVLDRDGNQQSLAADQVVNSLHLTPEERKEAQRRYEMAGGTVPDGMMDDYRTEAQRTAAEAVRRERIETQARQVTLAQPSEAERNNPEALGRAEAAVTAAREAAAGEERGAFVTEGADRFVSAVESGGERPAEALAEVLSDERLSDNDRESIKELAGLELHRMELVASHEEAAAGEAKADEARWRSRSVSAGASQGAVVTAELTDSEGRPQTVYVVGGAHTEQGVGGQTELVADGDAAVIYVRVEEASGEETTRIVHLHDLSNAKVVAESYIDLVEGAGAEREAAFGAAREAARSAALGETVTAQEADLQQDAPVAQEAAPQQQRPQQSAEVAAAPQDGLRQMAEDPEGFVDRLRAERGEAFAASLPRTEEGHIDTKRLTAEQRVAVNEAALGREEAVAAARQQQERLGAEVERLRAKVSEDLGDLDARLELRRAEADHAVYSEYVRAAEAEGAVEPQAPVEQNAPVEQRAEAVEEKAPDEQNAPTEEKAPVEENAPVEQTAETAEQNAPVEQTAEQAVEQSAEPQAEQSAEPPVEQTAEENAPVEQTAETVEQRAETAPSQEVVDAAAGELVRLRMIEAQLRSLEQSRGVPIVRHYDASRVEQEDARAAIEQGEAVKGWFADGKCHIYMPAVRDAQDAFETYVHEVVGHKGVQGFLTKAEFEEFLTKLAEKLPEEEVRRAIDEWADPSRSDADRLHEAMEEWIAHRVESGEMIGEKRRTVFEVIRDFFEELFGIRSDRAAADVVEDLFKGRDAGEAVDELLRRADKKLRNEASERSASESRESVFRKGTGEIISLPNGQRGVALGGEAALSAMEAIRAEKSESAPVFPQEISDLAAFNETFATPVLTPISRVKVSARTFFKMRERGRRRLSGTLKPTLEHPDMILKDGEAYLYVKLYRSEGKDVVYNVVAVERMGQGENYVASIHQKTNSNLRNKIKSGGLLISQTSTDAVELREQPQGLHSELPPNLYDKGTKDPGTRSGSEEIGRDRSGSEAVGRDRSGSGAPTTSEGSEAPAVQLTDSPRYRVARDGVERKDRFDRLMQGNPVEITSENYGGYPLNRDGAKAWALANLREDSPYRIRETGEQVYVTRVGINEVFSHGEREEAHLLSIGHIPAMLEEAKFIGEMENYKGNGKYPVYRYYLSPLKINGEDYTARIVVGVKDGAAYYNHVLTEIERGDLLDAVTRLSNSIPAEADLQKGGEAELPSRLKDTTFIAILQKWLSGETPENGVIPQGRPVDRKGSEKIGRDRKGSEAPGVRYRKAPIENGVWEKRYENGQLRSRMNYKKGKPEGLSEEWYENGQLRNRENYKEGEEDGLSEMWYENGQLRSRTSYKAGKQEGLSEMWYENGQLETRTTYKEGEEDGLSEMWYENGQLLSRENYKAGKKAGLSEVWYANGQPRARATYKDDKLEGLSERWYKNGQLSSRTNYKEDKMEGLSEEWYEGGQLSVRANFKDGKKDGVQEGWYQNGQQYYRKSYKAWKEDGLFEVWYENGQLKSRETFKDGKKEGVAENFDERGQLTDRRNYKAGLRDGLQEEWYENGQLKSRWHYVDGEPRWDAYETRAEDGTLTSWGSHDPSGDGLSGRQDRDGEVWLWKATPGEPNDAVSFTVFRKGDRADRASREGVVFRNAEAALRRAEAAGEVSAAAEAVAYFREHATPKNTTLDEVIRFRLVNHNSPFLLKRADGDIVDELTGERLGFDHRFMSNGEGAQAHGWGSYFSVKDLRHYADTQWIPTGNLVIIRSEVFPEVGGGRINAGLVKLVEEFTNMGRATEATDAEGAYREVLEGFRRTAASAEQMIGWIDAQTEAASPQSRGYLAEVRAEMERNRAFVGAVLDKLEGDEGRSYVTFDPKGSPRRHHYVVEIPDEGYLEEDKPVSRADAEKLLAYVQKEDPALAELLFPGGEIPKERTTGGRFYAALSSLLSDERKTGKQRASELLHRAGFVGIHYDGRQDGECYVIFHDHDAKIRDHSRFRKGEPLAETNARYNRELAEYLSGGLNEGHLFQLGTPGEILRSVGVPDLETHLTASLISKKSGSEKHPFDPQILKDLPVALQNPVAVFRYGDDGSWVNVIIETEHKGNNMLVGIVLGKRQSNREVNEVRGLFPKTTENWLRWIGEGKALYLNKERVQNIIETRGTNRPSQSQLDLNSVTKVVENFENPKLPVSEEIGGDRKGSEASVFRKGEPIAENVDKEKALRYPESTPAPIAGALTSSEELSRATKVVERFENAKLPVSEEIGEDRKGSEASVFRKGEPIAETNARYNRELAQQVAGTLQEGHVYSLGMPSGILRAAGIPNLPIELTAEKLREKSEAKKHPFAIERLENLPKALQSPIAVFDSRTHKGSSVILTELESKGSNYVVVLRVRKDIPYRTLDVSVNNIVSLYPKDAVGGVLDWINSGLMRWVDKGKASAYLSGQGPTYLVVGGDKQKLIDASKVIENFENPKVPVSEEIGGDRKGSEAPGVVFRKASADLRRAEAVGDVSGVAEAVAYFREHATPKNTTLDEVIRFRRVNHNSPFLLKKADGSFVDPETGERLGFDFRFMSSGEGAQAHGWGAYFSVEDLRKYGLTEDREYRIDDHKVVEVMGDNPVFEDYNDDWAFSWDDVLGNDKDDASDVVRDSLSSIQSSIERETDQIQEDIEFEELSDTEIAEKESRLEELKDAAERTERLLEMATNGELVYYEGEPAHHYEVEIPDEGYLEEEEYFLTADEKARIRATAAKEDPELAAYIEAHGVLNDISADHKLRFGREVYNDLRDYFRKGNGKSKYGAKQLASEFLNRAGFAGIHYVGEQDGECYVIFNEKDAEIVDHSVFRKGTAAEREEIERRAKAGGVWLKAPDGSDTQLSPEAWVTAQTAGFRVAYGDWDRAYGARWLTSDQYVRELRGDELNDRSRSVIDQVTEYYRTNYDGRVERPGLGEVMLDKHSVKDSYYHGVGRNKVAAFVAVPDVIERGVVIDEQENWKDRGYNSLTLAAPIKLGGEGYICAVVIKQTAQTGTNRFYLHEVYLQKDLQEASMGEEPLGDDNQGAISARNEPSPHPDTIAKVLRDYVRSKYGVDEALFEASGEPKAEVVEAYEREEAERGVRYRKAAAAPARAVMPLNAQWDGEWYSAEPESVAEAMGLPAAPAMPEYRAGQSIGAYAEAVEAYNEDPRVVFRKGRRIDPPQPPVITKEMSLYEIAQRQMEYNRAERAYDREAMRRMQALSKGWAKWKRYLVDRDMPLEAFYREMERMGIKVPTEQNVYMDEMLRASRETEIRRSEVEPLVERLTGLIRSYTKEGLLKKAPEVSFSFTDPVTGAPTERRGADAYDKVSLYFQAKDIVESERLGLVGRGREGFEDLVTDEKGAHVSPEAYVSGFEQAVGKAKAEALSDAMREMSHWSVRRLREAGLLTEERYRELTMGERRYYVPQRGYKVTEEVNEERYQEAELTAQGRQSLSGDPIAYMQSIMNTTVMRVVKNEQLQHFLEWAEANAAELARRGVLEIGETYYRRIGEDANGNPIYSPTKEAPTAEELRRDQRRRQEMAKLRAKQKRLNDQYAEGQLTATEYAAQSQQLSDAQDALRRELEIIYRDPNPMRGGYTNDAAEERRRLVKVYRDGVEYQIRLSQPFNGALVGDVLNGRTRTDEERGLAHLIHELGAERSGVASVTRGLSALRTQYNPAFSVTNFLRDQGTAAVSNLSDFGVKYQMEFLGNMAKVQPAVWKYVSGDAFGKGKYPEGKYGAYLKEFFEEGAATGWSFLPDVKKIRRTLREMSDPRAKTAAKSGTLGVQNAFGLKQALSILTESSELMTRFAEYVTSRERGYSKKEAATHAKELTVNFNRRGLLSNGLNALFGFWNASIQGTNKLLRLGRPAAVAAGVFFAGGLLQGWMQGLRDDDEDDKEKESSGRAFTEWELMTNICVGDLKVVLPQGLRGFWGLGVQSGLAATGRKDAGAAFIEGSQHLIGELLPNELSSLAGIVDWDEVSGKPTLAPKQVVRDVMPTAVQPVADVLLNQNFMGGQVYREPFVASQEGQVAQWSMGKNSTEQVYKDVSAAIWELMGGSTERNDRLSAEGTEILSDGLLLNPSVMEHLVESYTGGLGPTLVDAATVVGVLAGGDPAELRKLRVVQTVTKQEKDFTDTDKEWWTLQDFHRSRDLSIRNLRGATEGADKARYEAMSRRVDLMAPILSGEQLSRKVWSDGTEDEKLYVTWLETKGLLKAVKSGKVTPEEASPTIERLLEQYREVR